MTTTIKFSNTSLKARSYKMPSRGTQPEDYFLLIGSERLDNTRARTTKGRDKEYTYVQTKDQVAEGMAFYVEGVIPSGTKLEVITIEPEPKEPKEPKKPKVPAATATATVITKAPVPLKGRGKK